MKRRLVRGYETNLGKGPLNAVHEESITVLPADVIIGSFAVLFMADLRNDFVFVHSSVSRCSYGRSRCREIGIEPRSRGKPES